MKKIMIGFITVAIILVQVPLVISGSINDFAADRSAFNSNTGSVTFSYVLNDVTNGNVKLEIYDSANDLIRTIDEGIKSTGTQSIVWNGKDDIGHAVPEGSYSAKLGVSISGYEFLKTWPDPPDKKYSSPADVAFDSSGNVYVADYWDARILKFDSNGNFITKWGSYCTITHPDITGCVDPDGTGPLNIGDGQFNWPGRLAADLQNNIYVADTLNERIQKFDSNGNFITKWGSSGSGDGQFNNIGGVAVDSSGNVYAADFNNRIQKFDSNGNFITKWGSSGSGNGQFNSIEDMAVDLSGNIYVADQGNYRIQKFDSNGNFITKWGSSGSGNGQFHSSIGVAVDSSGNVYVAEKPYSGCGDPNPDCYPDWSNRIQKFDSNGNFITKWGSSGSGNDQFDDLNDVAVDSSGNVYAADWGNRRIQVFAPQITTSTAETTVLVDNTPPSIIIIAPTNTGTYMLNQANTANYSCSDAGSGINSCVGPVANGANFDTSTVGTKSFAVTATDNASNIKSQSVTYNVGYNFIGFSPPVDNPSIMNNAKAGQAIPLKWRLLDANNIPVTNLASVTVTAASLACTLGTTTDLIEEYAAGPSGLQNLGNGYYQFNWKTPTIYANSCKTLNLDIGDGMFHTALFQFP